jgi:hypothetical protein
MTLKLRNGVSTAETDYGTTLLDEDSGQYWNLNPTGVLVLRTLLEGGTPAQAVQELTAPVRGRCRDREPGRRGPGRRPTLGRPGGGVAACAADRGGGRRGERHEHAGSPSSTSPGRCPLPRRVVATWQSVLPGCSPPSLPGVSGPCWAGCARELGQPPSSRPRRRATPWWR